MSAELQAVSNVVVPNIVNQLQNIVSSPFSNYYLIGPGTWPNLSSIVRLSGVFVSTPGQSGYSAVVEISYTDSNGKFQTLFYTLAEGVDVEINKVIFIQAGTPVTISCVAETGHDFLPGGLLHVVAEIL